MTLREAIQEQEEGDAVVEASAPEKEKEDAKQTVEVSESEEEPFRTEARLEQPVDVERQIQIQTQVATSIEDDDDEKTRHWKSSPFAVGRVNVHWSDEWTEENSPRGCSPNATILKMAATFCNRTTRVGNMSVLYQRHKEGAAPEIVLVAGPFWFVTFTVTIPIILAISLVIFIEYITCYKSIWLEVVWAILTSTLLGCLLTASFSNPGIMVRQTEQPQEEGWIWNDQALTYRAPTAKYVPLCGVVVEGYDHVCPWVGTAIGAGNMKWFRRFLWMIAICLVYDLSLLWAAPCSK